MSHGRLFGTYHHNFGQFFGLTFLGLKGFLIKVVRPDHRRNKNILRVLGRTIGLPTRQTLRWVMTYLYHHFTIYQGRLHRAFHLNRVRFTIWGHTLYGFTQLYKRNTYLGYNFGHFLGCVWSTIGKCFGNIFTHMTFQHSGGGYRNVIHDFTTTGGVTRFYAMTHWVTRLKTIHELGGFVHGFGYTISTCSCGTSSTNEVTNYRNHCHFYRAIASCRAVFLLVGRAHFTPFKIVLRCYYFCTISMFPSSIYSWLSTHFTGEVLSRPRRGPHETIP